MEQNFIRELVDDVRGLGAESKKILKKRLAVVLPFSFFLGGMIGLFATLLISRGEFLREPSWLLVGYPVLMGIFTTAIWGYWGAFMLTLQLKDHERYLREKEAYENGERKIPPVKLHWVRY